MMNRAKPGLLPIAAVVLLVLAADAQASQITAAPTSDQPAMESAGASAGGRPEAATQPAPAASAPASAPTISSSVQESRLQATTRHEQSGDGAQNGVVAESTATAQGIWQIQISSCTSHCRGVSQVQTAKQRNRTVQTLGRSRHLTGTERKLRKDNRSKTNTGMTPTAQTRTDHIPISRARTGLAPMAKGSTGTTPIAKTGLTESRKTGLTESGKTGLTEIGKPDLTQIQLGCISHCFGTTTSTSQLPPGAHRPTMQELLDTIAQVMPSLYDVPAAEQNTVVQMSRQWQYGNGLGRGQTQTTSQLSSTAQSDDVLPADAARSGLGDQVPELVNQTEQGIWQLQIGCVAFCSQTRQVQQAEQSNTTLRSAGAGADTSSYPLTSSANVTTQTVWQVQVGCLMWCFDTEQQQTASSENLEGELPGQEAAERAAPPTGAPPSAGSAPPAGAPPTAGVPPTAGAAPPTSPLPRDQCEHSSSPGECESVKSLGGAWPQAIGGTAKPSSRHAHRGQGGRILKAGSGAIAEAHGGHTATARAGAGAGASVAIYPVGTVRPSVTLPRTATGLGHSSGAHRWGSPLSRSLAAGISSEAGSGFDAEAIALAAAIALCALAAAQAFRSKPIRRRRATEK